MRELANIRQLYKPIQPTVNQSARHVSYVEFLPDLRLQNYIYCYWQLQTSQVLNEPFHYRVVADGCIDIFFELTDPADSYVMGFCKKYTEFPLENEFNYIGIRFLPTMFPQLFRVNAGELSNRYEQLESVIPETADFISKHFDNSLSADAIRSLFDSYFIRLLANVKLDHDHRFYNALSVILENFGVINVETDLDTGVSPRQLRRLFSYYIGDSAKTFSKIVRFQNILRAKPSQQSLRENKLFFDGYYDQAHFIKEFKNLYGVTPGKAFGR